jgi:hypothetical protein
MSGDLSSIVGMCTMCSLNLFIAAMGVSGMGIALYHCIKNYSRQGANTQDRGNEIQINRNSQSQDSSFNSDYNKK